MGHITGFAAFLGDGVRLMLGLFASMLPKRLWPSLDLDVPATGSASFSGLVTFFVAVIIGVPGFLRYLEDLTDKVNRAALASPDLAAAGTGSVLLVLGFFTFLFLTPLGWLTMYLGLTGLVRAVAGFIGDGFGDPLLTAADSLVIRVSHSSRTKASQRRRESLEGPEIPDRVVKGAHLGMAGVDLVIVASRQKPAWGKGTVLLTGQGAYRVGTIEERTIAGRLRTLYPLIEHKDLEVFRRTVRYELPQRARD
jgi:hypothetical protein